MRLLRGRQNPSLREVCRQQGKPLKGSVVTIGNFDGVHVGHQAILSRLSEESAAKDLNSVVVVFEPQPMEFFKGTEAPARIMTFRDKYMALQECNVDYVFCLKFDKSLSGLSAEDFVERVLVDHLSVEHLVVGDDFRFGGDRSGDFDLLCELGKKYGFSVENTNTITAECTSQRASSTLVRSLLSQGDFGGAEVVLGRPFEISGRVVHGQKLGRTLGFPTANIALKRCNIPFSGVYAVKVTLEHASSSHDEVNGVANIGVKPTVGDFKPNLEIHFLDFEKEIYGYQAKVRFVEKIREERRFDGIDALKKQISLDVECAKEIFNSCC